MAAVTRRALFTLVAAIAAAPSQAIQPPPLIGPVEMVLVRYPWIERLGHVEPLTISAKLAEHLEWPISATRKLVREARHSIGPEFDRSAFVADLDRRIAAVLATGETPLPKTAFLEAHLAKGAAGVERYLITRPADRGSDNG